MCLTTVDRTLHTADENILCFKYLDSNNYSPCYPVLYKEKEVYHSEITNIKGISRTHECTKVYKALHSFVYAGECQHSMSWLVQTGPTEGSSCTTDNIAICIIPKGGHYYQSFSYYASDTLKVIKIVPVNTICECFFRFRCTKVYQASPFKVYLEHFNTFLINLLNLNLDD